jgi:hypothetical protein
MELYCVRCEKWIEPFIHENGPHYQADCPLCKRYIKFVPKHLIEKEK